MYRASSPDEEALVKAAKALGFNFKTPSPNVSVTVTLKNNQAPYSVTYQILNVNEFNSSRCVLADLGARVSVIVRRVVCVQLCGHVHVTCACASAREPMLLLYWRGTLAVADVLISCLLAQETAKRGRPRSRWPTNTVLQRRRQCHV